MVGVGVRELTAMAGCLSVYLKLFRNEKLICNIKRNLQILSGVCVEKRSSEQGCCAGAGGRFPLLDPRPVAGLAPSSPRQLWEAQSPSRWMAAFPLFPENSNCKAPSAGSPQQRRRPAPSGCPGPGGANPLSQGKAPSHPAWFCGPLGGACSTSGNRYWVQFSDLPGQWEPSFRCSLLPSPSSWAYSTPTPTGL